MSDPFQPVEIKYRVTEATLALLGDLEYPTVISTRGTIAAMPEYLGLLRRMKYVIVQFSFTSSRDDISTRVDGRAAPPTQLLKCMERLARAGVPVTARWQPYIPGLSEGAAEFAARVSSTGCMHVGFEHLKLPVEHNKSLWRELSRGVGRDLQAEYQLAGAVRDGREFILPSLHKFATVTDVAREVRRYGMTFGAADNEFQYLSDSACCCSGADRFPGFENYYKYNIAYAVRKCRGKKITYDAIEREWAPVGSVDRYLNSKSRLASRIEGIGSIHDHIRTRWNLPGAPASPSSFFGVIPSKRKRAGMLVYEWTPPIYCYAADGPTFP